MPTPQEVLDKLRELAPDQDPNTAAAALLTLGCKGVAGDSCACPLAEYLRRAFPGLPADRAVSVSPGTIRVGTAVLYTRAVSHQNRDAYAATVGATAHASAPDWLDRFIILFDGKHYPELSSKHCPGCGRMLSGEEVRDPDLPGGVCAQCVDANYALCVECTAWVKLGSRDADGRCPECVAAAVEN